MIYLSRDPLLEIIMPQVFEVVQVVLQRDAINKDGWFRSVSVRCSDGGLEDFGLGKIHGQSKQFRCPRELVEHPL